MSSPNYFRRTKKPRPFFSELETMNPDQLPPLNPPASTSASATTPPTAPAPIAHIQLANAILQQPQGNQSGEKAATEQSQTNQRHAQLDEILNQASTTPTTNISLLSRGLQLLSIAQLRQLLREYSLPTGGNKRSLVQRLVLFLETFCPNQQNLLFQFSLRLKKLLSIEPDVEQNGQNSPTQEALLPPEIAEVMIKKSPSIIFVGTDKAPLFGPHMIHTPMPSEVFTVQPANQLPHSTELINFIPILQITPLMQDNENQINKIIIQINGNQLVLQAPYFWQVIPDFLTNQCSIRVMEVQPEASIILVVRFVKRLQISSIMTEVAKLGPPINAEPTKTLNGVCPLTRKLISTPARGKNCPHADCFDLSGFLTFGFKFGTWACPICHKLIHADDLRIDPDYFKLVGVQK